MDTNSLYASVIHNSPMGYAYHKVTYNDAGVVDDYVFLDLNPAFEKLTGLKAKEIIGTV